MYVPIGIFEKLILQRICRQDNNKIIITLYIFKLAVIRPYFVLHCTIDIMIRAIKYDKYIDTARQPATPICYQIYDYKNE